MGTGTLERLSKGMEDGRGDGVRQYGGLNKRFISLSKKREGPKFWRLLSSEGINVRLRRSFRRFGDVITKTGAGGWRGGAH